MEQEAVALARTFTGQASPVSCVAFMPGMKQAMSGSQDGSVMIWNFKPQQRAYRLRGHKGAVTGLAVASDESFFVSGSADHSVRLWKPSVQGSGQSFRAHSGTISSVCLSEDNRTLLTGSADKMIKLWDLATFQGGRPKFLWCIHGHRNWVRDAQLGRGGELAVSASDDKMVKVWDTATSKEVVSFDGHTAAVHAARFDPLNGLCVASAGEDASLNIWDVRSGKVIQHYGLQQPSKVKTLCFHPSGAYLVSGGSDAALRVWDLREGRLLYTVRAHGKDVNACTFSHDGSHFLTGSSDQMVLAWKCDGLNEQAITAPAPELVSAALANERSRKRRHSKRRSSKVSLEDPMDKPEERRSTKDTMPIETTSSRRRGESGGSSSRHRHHHHHRHAQSSTGVGSSTEIMNRQHPRLEETARVDEEEVKFSSSGERRRRSSSSTLKSHHRKEGSNSTSSLHSNSKYRSRSQHDLEKESLAAEAAARATLLETLDEVTGRNDKALEPAYSSEHRGSLIETREQTNASLPPPSPSYLTQPIGDMTRQAAQAALRNRKPSTLHPPAPPLPSRKPPHRPPPPAPSSEVSSTSSAAVPLQSLARALQNVEARLRLNEEAVAGLQLGEKV